MAKMREQTGPLDERLSLRAKGLLAVMQALPVSHPMSVEALAHQLPESEYVIGVAVRELVKHGYYHSRKIHSGGRIRGMEVVWAANPIPDPWAKK